MLHFELGADFCLLDELIDRRRVDERVVGNFALFAGGCVDCCRDAHRLRLGVDARDPLIVVKPFGWQLGRHAAPNAAGAAVSWKREDGIWSPAALCVVACDLFGRRPSPAKIGRLQTIDDDEARRPPPTGRRSPLTSSSFLLIAQSDSSFSRGSCATRVPTQLGDIFSGGTVQTLLV